MLNLNDNRYRAVCSALRDEGNFLGVGLLLLTAMMQLTFSFLIQLFFLFGAASPANPDGYWGMGNTGFLLFYAVVYALAMGAPMLIASAIFHRPVRPFRRFCEKGEDAVSAGLSLLAGLGLCMFANLAASRLMTFFSLLGIPEPEFPTYLEASPVSLTLNILVLAVLPALLEEMVFRGFVLRALLPYGRRFAVGVSSALFALMHGNVLQIPFALIVGLACASLALRTGSLWPACLLHFGNNLLSVLLEYAGLRGGESVGNALTLTVFLVIAVFAWAAELLRQRRIFRGSAAVRPREAAPVGGTDLPAGQALKTLLAAPPFLISLLLFAGLLIWGIVGGGAG